ncbi:sugar phosphate isomerase/epimerase family protein [Methanolapillus ohkumae]|uniref:Endonuclease 4 n=1 Tax=Methanolapillus ohkumae TaxID=3028298 RepID=A0AA96V6U2_9EURY|nr:endonuclease 4 [Methanosarcinaceae archaeon Am2]
MKFGASTFAGSLSDLNVLVDSIELYIPKMNLYSGRVLQKDRLNLFLDEFFSYDLLCTAHAPYFPDFSGEYPPDLSVDMSDLNGADLRLLTEAIDITALAGGDVLVLHPGRITDAPKKSFWRMVHNLRLLAKYAEDAGVLLGLENKEKTDPLNLCCDAEELMSAVKAVDSEYLGAVLDIGHANLTCGGDQKKLAEFVKTVSPDVVHVHVHDNHGRNTGQYNGDEHLCPGQGIIDYSVLKNLGRFDGIFNFELFSTDEIPLGKEYVSKAFI